MVNSRSAVLTAVMLKIHVFLDVTLCCLVCYIGTDDEGIERKLWAVNFSGASDKHWVWL
jgi:hypothetical protein